MNNKILENLNNELIGKDLTWKDIENIVNTKTNRLDFDSSDKDSIFNENMYLAFENMSHSYEIAEDVWLSVAFEIDIEDEFDLYEDKVNVIRVEVI